MDHLTHDIKAFGNKTTFQSKFLHTHIVGNNGINANFVLPYTCSFLHYLHYMMLANVKLGRSINWYKIAIFQILQTSLVLVVFKGIAKTKLAILAFMYCGDREKLLCVRSLPPHGN